MTADASTVGFSWRFLDEISLIAGANAVLAAVIGAIVTSRPSFAVGCLLGAAVDIAIVHSTARWGRRSIERSSLDAYPAAVLIGGRVVVKAGLLGLAFAVPALDFAGTAVGVLVYDLTLAVFGSIIAVLEGRREATEGR